MTKEELKQEAEEYIKKNNLEWELECHRTSPIEEVKQAYVAGAEPREKRIEELEMTVGIFRTFSDEQATCIEKLEKENAELKQAKEGKVVEHFEAYGQCRDSKRIAELEAQIERMKSCKEEIIKALKESFDYQWLPAHNGKAKFIYLQTVIDIVNEKFEEIKEK